MRELREQQLFLENLLMDVDGVRAVNYVTLTQDLDYNAEAAGGGTGSGKAVCPCFGMASVIQRILGM